MKKLLAILLLTMMLGGCTQGIYDERVLITGKETWTEDYQYRYVVRLKYHGKTGDKDSNYRMYFYSNKNFKVGETIWIGNSRGETLRD